MADKSAGREKKKAALQEKHPMDVFKDAVKRILSVPKEEVERRIKLEKKRR